MTLSKMAGSMPQAKKLKLLRQREEERQAKVHAQVTGWFEKFDENGDGLLQREELRALLTHLNPSRPPTDANLDWLLIKATEISTHTMKLRGDKNGAVAFHDARATVMRYHDHCKDQAYLDAIFKQYDTDGNGELDGDELPGLLQRIAPEGCEVDDADVRFVLETCDLDGNGVITRDEVLPMISRWTQIAISKAEAKAAHEAPSRPWELLRPIVSVTSSTTSAAITPLGSRLAAVVAGARAKEAKSKEVQSRWKLAEKHAALQMGVSQGQNAATLMSRTIAAARAEKDACCASENAARQHGARAGVSWADDGAGVGAGLSAGGGSGSGDGAEGGRGDSSEGANSGCVIDGATVQPNWDEFNFAGPAGERRLVPVAGSSMDVMARSRRGSLDGFLPGLDAAIHDERFESFRDRSTSVASASSSKFGGAAKIGEPSTHSRPARSSPRSEVGSSLHAAEATGTPSGSSTPRANNRPAGAQSSMCVLM